MSYIRINLKIECYRCKLASDQKSTTPENGWFNPYYIMEDEGWFQTQLCPNCCPKLSFFMFCRKHPELRWLNNFYALLMRYFWLPCDSCGRYFGGHEKTGKGIVLSESVTKLTCSNC